MYSIIKFGSIAISTLLLWVSSDDGLKMPGDVKKAYDKLPAMIDYTYHVKPILSDRCFKCHGPDKNKVEADLRLDIPESALTEVCDNGLKAIEPRNAAKSELVHRILSDDPDYLMPSPNSHLQLNSEEKAILIKWINQGAEYKTHWSFVAPQHTKVPLAKSKNLVKNDIDNFILEKIEKNIGLKNVFPLQETTKTTLVRRIYLDLIGLPPTAAEVDDFLKDKSENTYEKLVDKLLKSPHFGENMAVEWLDMARYADTHGYQDDGLRTTWPYRDWVVNSFNQNLGFDKFTTWQLAGDLLPNPTKEQLLATAFNRNHQQSQEGGIVPEEYRTEYVADRANTFGKVFLGLTIECARCHDHKYDPISQKDYYSLFAFFNNNQENGQIPYNGEPSPTITMPTPEADQKLKEVRMALQQIEKERIEDEENLKNRFENWLVNPNRNMIAAKKDLIIDFGFEKMLDDSIPAKKPKEKPRREVKFINAANDTLPMYVNGDRDLSLPKMIEGKIGNAVELVGETNLELKSIPKWDKLKYVPTYSGWFEGYDSFTISVWVNIKNEKFNGPIFSRNIGVMNGYRGYELFRLSDGRLSFRLSNCWPANAIDIETTQKLATNSWQQITITYDGSGKGKGMKIYLNGVLPDTKIVADDLLGSTIFGKNHTNWGSGTQNICFGQAQDQNYKGYAIDELKVFSRKMTDLEAQSLYSGRNEINIALDNLTEKNKNTLYDYYSTHIDAQNIEKNNKRRNQQLVETDLLNKEIDLMVMKERTTPRPTYILRRGAYDDPEKEVKAETPSQFFKMPDDLPKNRLGLAQWLLHKDQPLYARVMVNRMWQHYFGKGLVVSAEDFGNQGDLPTHLELLDHLAIKFRESGWDFKAMQKNIVMSATYRQKSKTTEAMLELDPDNKWYARGPNYRISAEQVRDAALVSSKLFNAKIGGPSVRPYQPVGIWEALATRNAIDYVQNCGDTLYRRSMYTIWKRSSPPPMMLNFDAAERHTCTVRRQKTSTPLQALVVMNDPQFIEASRVLAQKYLETVPNNPKQKIDQNKELTDFINYAYKSLISRPARATEIQLLKQLYVEEHKNFKDKPEKMNDLLTVGNYNVDKPVDKSKLCAYTIVASTIMNFDEFVIKR